MVKALLNVMTWSAVVVTALWVFFFGGIPFLVKRFKKAIGHKRRMDKKLGKIITDGD